MKKIISVCLMTLMATSLALTSYASDGMEKDFPNQRVTRQGSMGKGKQTKAKATVVSFVIRGEARHGECDACSHYYEIKQNGRTLISESEIAPYETSEEERWIKFEKKFSIPYKRLSLRSPVTVRLFQMGGVGVEPVLEDELIIPINTSTMKETFASKLFRNVKLIKASTCQ